MNNSILVGMLQDWLLMVSLKIEEQGFVLKAGWPAGWNLSSSSQDLWKRPSPPSHKNTLQILWGNKAWAERLSQVVKWARAANEDGLPHWHFLIFQWNIILSTTQWWLVRYASQWSLNTMWIFFPESLIPCLQLKNNLRVNKISLFLYLNRHVSLYKIHEKNSHKTVYITIVRKCYLIKSYWYFISFHWSYSLLWSIKHQVLHVLVLLLFQVLRSVNL